MSGGPVDIEALRELKEIMEDQFVTLVETFLEDSATRMNEIEAAIAAGDADGLRSAAHSLKGSSSNLGISSMADVLFKLESMGRDGTTDGGEALIPEVRTLFAEVSEILKAEL